MMRLGWQPGPLADWVGPVYVSVTRFTYRRRRHLPLVYWHGLRLRSAWSGNDGAVGLSLTADWATRSTFTISAWRDKDDLMRWVRGDAHARLMRAFAPRLESIAVDGWMTDVFDLRAAWVEGLKRVA
jgi:hypothetical protein